MQKLDRNQFPRYVKRRTGIRKGKKMKLANEDSSFTELC